MIETSAAYASDDTDLLEASRGGGLAAFGQLVERYQNLVCAVAYSRTGDRLLSEDIGQETFLAAWSKLDTVREPEKLRSWLCGIARNLSSKAVRVRHREVSADTEVIDANADPAQGPLESVLSKEAEQTVWKALEELPEKYREPLVLFYWEDQSIEQVARGLGLTADAAKQRLSRGRQALKEGVSTLVERTLESSRPSKAFAAAVLGTLAANLANASAAAAKASTSAPGSSAGTGTGKLLLAGLVVGSLIALIGAAAVSRSGESSHRTAEPGGDESNVDREVLAFLHGKRRSTKQLVRPDSTCAIRGAIVGVAGEPVTGAVVAIAQDSMQSTVLDPKTTASDAKGAWESGPLQAGSYLISITAPGHRAETRIERCSDTISQPIEIHLAPGGSRLHGAITDVGGGSVPAVTIWLLPTLGQTGVAIATRTKDDGTYEVNVHPDRYMLLAVHPDYVLDARPVLVAGDQAREDFVLLPGAAVEGVVGSTTGEPVVGARVSTGGVSLRGENASRWIFSSLFGAMFPVVSDSQGRFRLSGLPPGPVGISARTQDLVSKNPAAVDLAIAETESGVAVQVSRAFTVSGFVVRRERDREGVPDVNVLVQREGVVETPNFAVSDRAGYFEISGVVPGEYRIFAAGALAAPTIMHETVRVVESDLRDVLVRVEQGVSISGRIDPPGRAALSLEPASYEKNAAGFLALAASSMNRAVVDDSGAFTFPAVAQGDYVIVARTLDGEGRTPVRVARKGESGLVVAIRPLSGIEGRVVDGRGSPVSNVLVAASAKGSPDPRASTNDLHARARTDESGGFKIVGLHDGRYEIRVFDSTGQRAWNTPTTDKAFEPREIDVRGSTPVEMVLAVASGGKTVRGVALGPDGTPIKDAWVKVVASGSREAPAGHDSLPTLTDGFGRFQVAGLFGEEFEVEATGPRGDLQSAPQKVLGDASVTLKLGTLSTVSARVTHHGEPVPEFEVGVSGGPSRVIGRLVDKKPGEFQLPRMVSGSYEIEVKAENGYAKEVIQVGPAATTSVELRLQPPASIRGRLIDSGGAPLLGAAVMVSGVTLDMDEAEALVGKSRPQVGSGGSFEVRGLTAGRGHIMFMRSGRGFDPVASLEFDLKPGEQLDLGTITTGQRPSLSNAPSLASSSDLGVDFYAGRNPPTAEQLRQIDQATEPRRVLTEKGARLWIASVVEGGPAHQAGLRTGDHVVSVGQMKVGDDLPAPEAMISLSQRWRSKGRAVDWVVQRGGRELRLEVVVPR